ncbi:C-type cytochrome [Gammaproteobacteria bacterium]
MKRVRTSAILATAIGLLVFQGANAENRGAEIFDGLCNRCHGPQGQGVRGLEAPLIAGMPAWYIEGQLKKFRDGLRGTHPKDMPGMRMRPMANTLKESDLSGISAYVANLPGQVPAASVQGGDPEKGKASFMVCSACHGADAKGNQQMGAPTLAGQDDWYLIAQLKNFKSGIRGSDSARDPLAASMRPMAATLDDQAMKDVAAYLRSLSRK